MISPRSSPEKLTSGQHKTASGQHTSTSGRHRDDVQKRGVRSPSPTARHSVVSTSSHSTSSSSKHLSTSPPPISSSTNPPSSSTFRGKPTLAQEIYDEFLVCKICLEGYKNPKGLECLHTFCEQCVETHIQAESTYKKYSDYREFTCPLCRKRTQLPIGGVKKLPDNFLVSNLSEMVGRRRLTKYPFCDICKLVDQKYREGTAKCLDCSKMLCPSCVTEHQEIKVTSGHSIFDIEIEKNIGCVEHPDEMVRFYCEPCEVCVCVLCTFKEHRQHKVTQFSEAVTAYKAAMETMVDQCLGKMDQFDRNITSLTRCEENLVQVRKKINETAAAFAEEVERRRQQLLTELDNIYGHDCLEYIDQKQDLSSQVDNIRSTSKLAKTILGGKDIELLLLRKDIEEKLTSLNKVELKQLPGTVSKVVEFVVGSVDFGHIYDNERPLLTTMTVRKKPESSAAELEALAGSKTKTAHAAGNRTSRSTTSAVPVKSSKRDSSDFSESSSSSTEDDDSSESSAEAAEQNKDRIYPSRRVATVERSTMTDTVVLIDRAINTKARSMLNPGGTGGGSGSSGRRPSVDHHGDEWNEQSDKKNRKREKMEKIEEVRGVLPQVVQA